MRESSCHKKFVIEVISHRSGSEVIRWEVFHGPLIEMKGYKDVDVQEFPGIPSLFVAKRLSFFYIWASGGRTERSLVSESGFPFVFTGTPKVIQRKSTQLHAGNVAVETYRLKGMRFTLASRPAARVFHAEVTTETRTNHFVTRIRY